ncbi:MAG: carbon-phosphorus lyase complex subunit PhnI [Acidimicrobiales bacterium]
MGYVAARGGLDAIEAAENLVRRKRSEGRSSWLEQDQLVERLRLLVDRVMSEGSLWAPELAARALRQAEGDPIEAATLLRSHRSTLPRLAVTEPVSADEIEILRRIVPAFRTPPGPQLLGRTLDYVGRLLDTTDEDTLRDRSVADALAASERTDPVPDRNGSDRNGSEHDGSEHDAEHRRPRRLLELLRDLDLVVDRRNPTDVDPEPYDISRDPVRPGVPRSALLSVMARAEAGALVNLWYRNILGPDGHLHEITLGEVRHGSLPVVIAHPATGSPVSVGEIRVTEVEAIEDLDGLEEDRGRFDVGYGLVAGHDERKAIAMANLDIAVHRDGGRSSLTQSVLLTTDGLEASGFLEHLKLPHYVTFRSMIERKQAVRTAQSGGPA